MIRIGEIKIELEEIDLLSVDPADPKRVNVHIEIDPALTEHVFLVQALTLAVQMGLNLWVNVVAK